MNKYVEYVISRCVYSCYKLFGYKESSDGKAILVTCFCPIGDTMVVTPFVRELRRNYPDYHISIVTNKMGIQIFEPCPYVDEVMLYDDRAKKHYFLHNLKKAYKFAKENLIYRRYSMIFCMEYRMPKILSAWLALFSGAGKRVAFTEKAYPMEHEQYMGVYDLYFTNLLYDTSIKHDVEKNLDLLRLIDVGVCDNSLEFWLTEQDRERANNLMVEHGLCERNKNMIVVLGTSLRDKEWPAERFAAVCKRIMNDGYDCSFILLGNGDPARMYAEKFLQYIPEACNLVNKTTIRESMAVMLMSRYYFGGDTGPMHMACACGLSGVCVYKEAKNLPEEVPFNAAKVLYPWQADIAVVQPEKYLQGCEGSCKKEYPHCIMQITVDEVYEALIAKIEKVNRRKVELNCSQV